MYTDPETGEITNGIMKVRYSHDAMIDLMIADPTIRQNDLAAIFDRTPSWISLVVNSDAFQARLEERRKELVDPALTASIKERLSAIADTCLQKVLERVSQPVQLVSDDYLLQTAKFATAALGYGARPTASVGDVNVGVVVQVPNKIASAQDWVAAHSPRQVEGPSE